HRLLGVVQVQVDTVGSSGSELSLDALEMDRAEALRDFILRRKEDLVPETEEAPKPGEEPVATRPTSSQTEDLMRLRLGDLLRVGLTQNHLQTVGILLGFLFTTLNLFDDIWTPENLVDWALQAAGIDLSGWGWVITLYTIALIIVSFVATLVRTILEYFDLRLQRLEDGFKLTAGLLNRREQIARFRRLQWVRWRVNPLQARLGLHSVQLHQAGPGEKGKARAITIPGALIGDRVRIVSPYASEADQEGMAYRGISRKMVGRFLLWIGFLPMSGFVVLLIVEAQYGALPFTALWPLLVWWSVRHYQRHYRWGWNGRLLHLHHRFFGTRDTLVWAHKLQSVKLSQGLYQRRKRLADLELHTASGDLTIPYLPVAEARTLRDHLLWTLETSRADWM
ncbi:MAG: hypothetical protein D6722_02690, partial [Bacteroidetes bacterium]